MEVLVAVSAVMGLALGSFANVVIHRVPNGDSVVKPASACPQCGARLRRRHNIPVLSWLWLRGRCFDCGVAISGQYPLIELVTCLAFVGITLVVGFSWTLPLLLILGYFSVVLSAIDFKTGRLPDAVTVPFAITSLLALVVLAVGTGDINVLVASVVGAVGLGLFYFIAFIAHPRGMGFGDVKLAFVLGAVLGSLGWSQLVVGGAAAFLWGSMVGVGAMIATRRRRHVRIPFGPWMFAGAWTGVIAGPAIAVWYLRMVGLT